MSAKTIKIQRMNSEIVDTVPIQEFLSVLSQTGRYGSLVINGIQYDARTVIISSTGLGIGDGVTLNLSDPTIYNVATRTLNVPLAKRYADIFTFTADLYVPSTVYALNRVVKSDGTNEGVEGKFYKSLASGNQGNLLSDEDKWEFADSEGDDVGDIEIISFGSPISLPTDHNAQFETENLTAVTFVPTVINTPIATGQIMLPTNTPITIQGRNTINDIISFNVQNGIARSAGISIN